MNNTTLRLTDRQRAHRRNQFLAAVAAIVIVGGTTAAIAGIASSGTRATGIIRTGESNSMGMPVIETPGTSSGTATATGVSASPSSFALGLVPLNMAVRPTWTIDNTGTDAITIGEPHVQINQGCCPGPFTFQGSSTVAPGAETGLTFELSMHPGMDGAHDMTVHVPVQHADGSIDTLTLGVTGDFRG